MKYYKVKTDTIKEYISKSSKNYKRTKFKWKHSTSHKLYEHWKAMHQRIKDHKNFPTYIGCSIAPEWYSYDTFYEWAIDSGWAEGLCLDKDIKIPGNRLYSPETCSWVSKEENTAEVGRRPHKTGYRRPGRKVHDNISGKDFGSVNEYADFINKPRMTVVHWLNGDSKFPSGISAEYILNV